MGLNLAVQYLEGAHKSKSNPLFIGLYFKEAEGCSEEELMGTQKGTVAAGRGFSLQ